MGAASSWSGSTACTQPWRWRRQFALAHFLALVALVAVRRVLAGKRASFVSSERSVGRSRT